MRTFHELLCQKENATSTEAKIKEMKILGNDKKPQSWTKKKILNFFGRGFEAERADQILSMPFESAAYEIVSLAERLFVTYHNISDDSHEGLLLIASSIIRKGYTKSLEFQFYEIIFDSFIHLHISSITNKCTGLFLFLIQNDNATFRPLLDRYLNSTTPSGRQFGARILFSVNTFTENDGTTLIRLLRDSEPQVIQSVSGALFLIYRKNLLSRTVLAQEVSSMKVNEIEIGSLPIVSQSRKIEFLAQLFSFKWYGFYFWLLQTLNPREDKTHDSLDEKTESLEKVLLKARQYTFLIFSGQLILTYFFWILYTCMEILNDPLKTTNMSWLENILWSMFWAIPLAGMLIYTINRLVLWSLGTILAFSAVKIKYKSIDPAPLLLRNIEKGIGTYAMARDLAQETGDNEQIKRRLLRLAMENEIPLATDTVALLVENKTITYETFRSFILICRNNQHELEQIIDLFYILASHKEGNTLVNRILNSLWSHFAHCQNIEILLDSNITLSPPLLLKARERLSKNPLENFGLMLQVLIEAPKTYPIYQNALITGTAFCLAENVVIPPIFHHLVRLYPEAMDEALLTGHRFRERDTDKRNQFIENLFQSTSSSLNGQPGLFSPYHSADNALTIKAMICEENLSKKHTPAIDALLEYARCGLGKEFFSKLKEMVRVQELSHTIHYLSLLLWPAAEDIQSTLRESSCHFTSLADEASRNLGGDLALAFDIAKAQTPKELFQSIIEVSEKKLTSETFRKSFQWLEPEFSRILKLSKTIHLTSDEVEENTIQLLIHGILLKISEDATLPGRTPFSNAICIFCEKLRAVVSSNDCKPLSPSNYLSSTNRTLSSIHGDINQNPEGKAFMRIEDFEDLNLVNRYIHHVVAPTSLSQRYPDDAAREEKTQSVPETEESIFVQLGQSIAKAEQYEWMSRSRWWFIDSRMKRLVKESINQTVRIFSKISCEEKEEERIVALLLSTGYILCPRLRENLIHLSGRRLTGNKSLQSLYAQKIETLKELKDYVPLLLEPLHYSLARKPESLNAFESELFIESGSLIGHALDARKETIRCAARIQSLLKDPATESSMKKVQRESLAKEIDAFKKELTPTQQLMYEEELLRLGDRNALQKIVHIVESCDFPEPHPDEVFTDLSKLSPKAREQYVHHLSHIFDMLRRIGGNSESGVCFSDKEQILSLLEALQKSTSKILSYGATIELLKIDFATYVNTIPDFILHRKNSILRTLIGGVLLHSFPHEKSMALLECPHLKRLDKRRYHFTVCTVFPPRQGRAELAFTQL